MPTVTSDFPQMLGQLLRVMEMLLDSGHHEAAARIAFLAPLPSSRPPPPPLPPHWCPLSSPPPNPPTRPKRRRRRRRRSKSPTSSTAFSSHLSAEINEPPHSVCEPPVTSVIMEELERDKFALEVLPILKPASVTNEISNYAENEDLAASNYAKDEDITEVSAFEEKEETHFRTRTSSSPPVPVLPSNFCHTNAVLTYRGLNQRRLISQGKWVPPTMSLPELLGILTYTFNWPNLTSEEQEASYACYQDSDARVPPYSPEVLEGLKQVEPVTPPWALTEHYRPPWTLGY